MKGSIIAILAVCIFTLTGWSSQSIMSTNSKEDTIHSIRDDKTDIIGISYSDIIKKIGKPDVASYTIKKEAFKANPSIQGIIKNSYISLLYKNESKMDLYVNVENDKVRNSYCMDRSLYNRSFLYGQNSDGYKFEESKYINIDCYEGESMINEHKINIDELKEYEQKTLEQLDSKLEKQNPNIKVYLTKFENINIYLLESSTYMSDKILVVESHKNLIKKVELMSSTSIDEVIKHCSKKL